MKLDRYSVGRGKYALIKLRQTDAIEFPARKFLKEAKFAIVKLDAIDFGATSDTEFFVIRLKDKYAAAALGAYAMAAHADDPEYALQVLNLAKHAAEHPDKYQPD